MRHFAAAVRLVAGSEMSTRGRAFATRGRVRRLSLRYMSFIIVWHTEVCQDRQTG